MKIVLVTKDNTEYARAVSEWLDAVRRDVTGGDTDSEIIEVLDPESIEGEMFCMAHDVVQYPTVLAVDDRGSEQKVWKGELPAVDEMAYWVNH